MNNDVKISYKIQNYLCLIPLFGWHIVLLTSIYNIFSKFDQFDKKIVAAFLYFVCTMIPTAIFFGIGYAILRFAIMQYEYIVIIIASCIIMYIIILMSALCSLIIEKLFIKKIG